MSRLDEVTAKVDAFFARVVARHGDDMQCATGCADCCHVRLTITAVEAAAIRSEVARWPAERRRALAPAPGGTACAALDAHARCKIYDVRPVVCRSHGAPIRMRDDSPAARRLPVVQSCPRNFTRVTPDADCIIDQTTLSALVLAVDRAFLADCGQADPAARVDLAGMLAELAAT